MRVGIGGFAEWVKAVGSVVSTGGRFGIIMNNKSSKEEMKDDRKDDKDGFDALV